MVESGNARGAAKWTTGWRRSISRRRRKSTKKDIFFSSSKGAELAGLPLSMIKPKRLVPIWACCNYSMSIFFKSIFPKPNFSTPKFSRGFLSQFAVFKSLSSLVKFIRRNLETIHPNPGPGRDKSELAKMLRRQRRYVNRKQKRKERRQRKKKPEERLNLELVAWNVQEMSVGTRNKRKLRLLADHVEKRKFDAVFLAEIKAESEGIVWLGEEENQMAVIHSKRAGILLRGDMLRKWREGGKKMKRSDRTVSVKAGELQLVATYLPVWYGNNNEEIEAEKEILKEHIDWCERETVVVGGDFNAHVGGEAAVRGVCGGHGLRASNQKGHELLEFCLENGLSHVNSFFQHKNRGTWFSPIHEQWYEIDGFLVKQEEQVYF